MNISMGTESIFIRTRLLDRPGSRLHGSIIICLIAPEMAEIFEKLECQYWVHKFDTGHSERNLGFSPPFLLCFFCFLAHFWESNVH